MITIRLTRDDLLNLRFAYRPLLEIPLSYRVLITPEFQGSYYRWVDEASRALYDVDLPYLSAMVTGHGYIPDFLTPTPNGQRVDLEADLTDLIATPDDTIRAGALMLIEEHGDSEMRRFFVAHPRQAVQCLVDDLRVYWQRALAHYWSRMVTSLESDVLYRARKVALDGAPAVFGDLHSSIGFRGNRIEIQPICQHGTHDHELALAGDGLQLVPLIFRGCGRMFQVTPEWPSMLAYGVRAGGLWYQKAPSTNQSLELALGTGRARVLRILATPASTGEVAHHARISAATASQHLQRLTRAGLVQPHRSGQRVYYQLTRRGEELLSLFDRTD